MKTFTTLLFVFSLFLNLKTTRASDATEQFQVTTTQTILKEFEARNIDLFKCARDIAKQRMTYAQTAFELLTSDRITSEQKFTFCNQVDRWDLMPLGFLAQQTPEHVSKTTAVTFQRMSLIWSFLDRSLDNYDSQPEELFPYERFLTNALHTLYFSMNDCASSCSHVGIEGLSKSYLDDFQQSLLFYECLLLMTAQKKPQVLDQQPLFVQMYQSGVYSNNAFTNGSMGLYIYFAVGANVLTHLNTNQQFDQLRYELAQTQTPDLVFLTVGESEATLRAVLPLLENSDLMTPIFVSDAIKNIEVQLFSEFSIKPGQGRFQDVLETLKAQKLKDNQKSFLPQNLPKPNKNRSQPKKKKRPQTVQMDEVTAPAAKPIEPKKNAPIKTKTPAAVTAKQTGKKNKAMIMDQIVRRADHVQKILDIQVKFAPGYTPSFDELSFYKQLQNTSEASTLRWSDFSKAMLTYGWHKTNGNGSLRTFHAPFWMSQVQTSGADALKIHASSFLVHRPHGDSDNLHMGCIPFIQNGLSRNMGLSLPMIEAMIKSLQIMNN